MSEKKKQGKKIWKEGKSIINRNKRRKFEKDISA